MSDRVVKSDHGSDRSAGQSLQPYQSAWMAHWKNTSCKLAIPLNYAQGYHGSTQSPSSVPEMNDNSKISRGFREGNETKTVHIMNERLASSSEKLRKEGFECQPFPMLNFSGKGKSIVALQDKQNVDNPLKSRKHGTKSFLPNNGSLLGHDPSTNDSQLPDFVGNQCQKMQKHSGSRLFPSQNSPSVATRSENVYQRQYLFPRVSSSVHDAKTIRIQTTMDAAEDLSRGPSKISKTTHHLFTTKKTDVDLYVNLSEGRKIFRESTVSTTLKRKGFSKLISFSPDFGFKHQQGAKLQLLKSSIDGKQKGNAEDVNTYAVGEKNISSTEIETTDLDAAFPKSKIFGVNLSPSNKASIACPDASLGPEPSSRWVKRLKLNTSDSFGHGTGSSKMGETLMDNKSRGKEQMSMNHTAVPLRSRDPSSVDALRRNRDIILSHSWIRRWCRGGVSSPQKNPEAVVVWGPKSSDRTSDGFEEQFPSVAAMALTGKAMSGFRPCKFRRTGSFIVWNTKRF